MLNPLRSSHLSDGFRQVDSDDVVLTLHSDRMSVTVARDGFSIGSHHRCDLKLTGPSIPLLHSIIHHQCGAVWIEAADDETVLNVNERHCRRMALRPGDHFQVGPFEFTIDFGRLTLESFESSASDEPVPFEETTENLAELSAEELCDRIVSEQSMIKQLSEEVSSGWEALLHAIESVHETPLRSESPDEPTIAFVEEREGYDRLIDEIDQMQETIAEQTNELDEQEAIVGVTSTLMKESQQREDQRLDVVIEQLNKSESPNELRASA